MQFLGQSIEDTKKIIVSMSSPSVTRGGYAQTGTQISRNKRQFAESNPHTLVGLQKVKVQLEKEINKLDKQQATAVTNIANHQQAMKMTWRRLEQRRVMESPLLSRSKLNTERGEESGPRRGIFHSKTKLYVKNTPDIYHPEAEDAEGKLSSVRCMAAAPPILLIDLHCVCISLIALLEGHGAKGNFRGGQFPSSLATRHSSSPYISSPYNFRYYATIN